MQYVNYIGLDLGQAADYTALTFLESPVWVGEDELYDLYRKGSTTKAGWNAPAALPPEFIRRAPNMGSHEPPVLLGRALKRYPLQTPYPAIVEDVASLIARVSHPNHTALVVDYTGVGRPVYDMFTSAGLKCIGVTITGGDQVNQDGDVYRVPKRDLIGAAQQLLQSEHVKFSAKLRDWEALKTELRAFKMKISLKTGHDTYEAWRERDHDDLVLSFALAAWFHMRMTQGAGIGFSRSYNGGKDKRTARAASGSMFRR